MTSSKAWSICGCVRMYHVPARFALFDFVILKHLEAAIITYQRKL